MIRVAVRVSLLLGLLLLSACAGGAAVDLLSGPRPDLVMTWQRAWVALPGSQRAEILENVDFKARLGRLSPGRRWPVVLYMHGCDGMNNQDVLTRLAAGGFVVIAPDSFARRYRPMQCDPVRRTGGVNRFVYDMRMTELSFALDRLLKSEWVDKDNIYLFGTSEGAVPVALYRGDEPAGRILAQWTCHGASLIAGIEAPPDEPILSIVRRDDPWYSEAVTRGQRGDCSAYFGDRPMSKSILLPGKGHQVLNESTLATIIDYLHRWQARRRRS